MSTVTFTFKPSLTGVQRGLTARTITVPAFGEPSNAAARLAFGPKFSARISGAGYAVRQDHAVTVGFLTVS